MRGHDDRPVTWSPAAVAAVMAMRQQQHPTENITTGAAIFAWTQLLPPGSSAIARALRDQRFWPNYVTYVTDWVGPRRQVGNLMASRSMVRWEADAEERARRDGSLRVGERHVFQQIDDFEWTAIGVSGEAIRQRVRDLEIGPALNLERLQQWSHAVLDLSALIEYRRPDEIRWAEIFDGNATMVWLMGSVLNELDDVKLSDRKKARRRATARASWVWGQLDAALGDIGVEIRPIDGTRLKVWMPPGSGLRDTDHLEAALTLRSLGLRLTVVTDDMNMAARAKLVDLPVVRLDNWRLPDDDGPAATVTPEIAPA